MKVVYFGVIVLVYFFLYEGFGMFVVEVLVCVCLVIICVNVFIFEVVGEVVIYVDGNDVDGLMDVLCEV